VRARQTSLPDHRPLVNATLLEVPPTHVDALIVSTQAVDLADLMAEVGEIPGGCRARDPRS
jgi:hypothetical protein